MKRCNKCGREIVNGVNGCSIMPECFDCHGGYPKYPPPRQARFDEGLTWSEVDALEDKCLGDMED